ncbi:P-type conjugative transfer ATPase TrbB [Legionella pneumophila]|uniref:P-type conjugative transfer ATPase TrbB n=1 Tax=Legionella pneumophila TaxID=446 RepID=UPI000770976D|nr:P-type conjugative transfer ATPase TrbB [Legionella pneumophila]CZP19377.1 Pertussis toxin liberation protein H [Legionella pneumophila]CZP47554.1 Pertussis toxin liberation protein H [Legionella pneumophila]HAT4435247.1 P-type conjugative transfer ATPase TrbB [Legionella pneumophila]HAT8603955.1 P-type conjugative transfer ATPase TrbB [Legionella pneumophila]HAU0130308.1 P-type conjugative transfer ATPase TrbB [Legionella pneumophila]
MNIDEQQLVTVKDRAKEKLRRDLGGLIETALSDPKTVELMLNADGKLWQERLGETMRCIGSISNARAESIIKTVAGFHGKEVTRFKPILEGELPLDGSRFAGQLPPVVSNPTFAIRKKAISVFTLDEYVQSEIMTAAQCKVIKKAVSNHRNILVIGGTGSGKTTLVNTIINEMVRSAPEERVFIIEDTGEIQCSAENCVQYHTTIDVSMTQLLKTTLRMRPDRILVGEVRGSEALDLLDAWNTGHEGGAATLHANNALAGLHRLKSLITRNPAAPAEIEPLIGEAVHCVVHIARTPQGRRVEEIISVNGFENGQYLIEKLI